MSDEELVQGRGQLATYGTLRPGDSIVRDGTALVVTAVRRAQGRKPKVGENLHLMTVTGVLKVNSLASVRMHRSPLNDAAWQKIGARHRGLRSRAV